MYKQLYEKMSKECLLITMELAHLYRIAIKSLNETLHAIA